MSVENDVSFTLDDASAAFEGPAVLSNRFFVSVSDAGVRIAFCEKWGQENPTLFRTAVTMGYADAIDLHKLLKKMLQDIEPEVEKLKASQNV